MKVVIAVWHSANKGKTETLRAFANLLLDSYSSDKVLFPLPADIPSEGDFRLVIEVNGVIIGIESQGDPNTGLKSRLLELADTFKCDVILCTTRTKGETVAAVANLAVERDFEIVWTSTYQKTNGKKIDNLNMLKAKHLHELIQEFSPL